MVYQSEIHLATANHGERHDLNGNGHRTWNSIYPPDVVGYNAVQHRMNTIKLATRWAALCGAGLLSACCCTSSKSTDARTVALFNGVDLTGWKFHLKEPSARMTDVWSVQDGVLMCKGTPLGYLYTEDAFTNFRLKVDWRWAPGTKPGNSGVLLRINGEPKPLPRCTEAQLQSGNAGDLVGLQGMTFKGEAARLVQITNNPATGLLTILKKAAGKENPPGEWNTYEILADGPRLEVWVNGVKANEATDAEVRAGPVGLQSEGGEVHFRNVRLTRLGP
jgi:hypothetical protein